MLKFSTSGQKAEESSNSKLPHPTPPSGFQSALSVPMHTHTHAHPQELFPEKSFPFHFKLGVVFKIRVEIICLQIVYLTFLAFCRWDFPYFGGWRCLAS